VTAIIQVLLDNANQARRLVSDLAPALARDTHGVGCACRHALDHALITAPERRDPALLQQLRGVAGRVL
jgi:5'-methylthioadenosine phosphorylase